MPGDRALRGGLQPDRQRDGLLVVDDQRRQGGPGGELVAAVDARAAPRPGSRARAAGRRRGAACATRHLRAARRARRPASTGGSAAGTAAAASGSSCSPCFQMSAIAGQKVAAMGPSVVCTSTRGAPEQDTRQAHRPRPRPAPPRTAHRRARRPAGDAGQAPALPALHHPRTSPTSRPGSAPPSSELCLGGLIKHVTAVERSWADFIVRGPVGDGRLQRHDRGRLRPPGRRVPAAARRDAGGRAGRLRGAWPRRPTNWSPRCPTSTPPTRCRRRRGSRRARAGRPAACCCTSSPRPPSTPGHADIIRESLDGAKTMG